MSYDINIWSVKKTSFEDEFFSQHNIKQLNDKIIYEGYNWRIVIGKFHKIIEEDIPEEVYGKLPGISYFTEIILEPIDAPKRALQILNKIVKILAKSAHGIIFDVQKGTISFPSGVKRLENIPLKEDPSTIQMSWWFLNDYKFKNDGFKKFLDLIESMIPEAMPKRYGLYEPPQFKLTDKGKEHFIQFSSENLYEEVVWYPSKPFTHIGMSIPDKAGPTSLGYRSCYIEMHFLEEVMKQPGWALEIKRFWLESSKLLNPFFSEIRRGRSPVCSWWWRGIPKNLGFATLLGEPYIDLWSDFIVKAKQTENGLFYIENIEGKYTDIYSIISNVPERIAQPKNEEKYPRIWPFNDPFKED
ncbi:hypothetical protein M3568_18110 [Priestia flexa]|uniref:hypothetical protein n=1 Tax=Priestia flexa TaxID=86664 RepID=UPI00203A7582|nr:hypothetical protein [Priestia flexa]MCM3068245.1 hypothetical protein [Priestia flexa]